MKYAYAALALVAAVHAQTREDIPECALPCLDDAITSETDCKTTDYVCVCKNFDAVQGAATGCVISECGADVAIGEVLPATEALCKNPGGGDDGGEEPSPTTETTPEPTEEPEEPTEPTEAPEEPTEAPEEPTEAPEEPTPAPSKTECSSTLSPTVAPTNGTIPAPTDTGAPVPTGAAAAYGPLGGLALAGLAALAL
ncbi:hypothetical protein ACO1O0_003706 [Amphichorda felina]